MARSIANPRFLNPKARTINEVTIPATHNSYNYAPRFRAPNVNESVTQQLQNGIRAIELDPHYLRNQIKLFHGVRGLLGSQPAAEVLKEVLTFIQRHPTEVVVIKLNSTVPPPDLVKLMDRTGLSPYLYRGGATPTYAELVRTNRRILITNAPGVLTSRLRLCTTRWNLKSPQALWPPREYAAPCAGDFLSLVAFATTPLGTGSRAYAQQINNYPALLNLAETAWKLNGKKIWRLEVNFPDIGNVYRVADTLNRWSIFKGEVRDQTGKVLPEVSWTNQYSLDPGRMNTTTHGRFSFPVKPNETVTMTPSHPDFVFRPASLALTNRRGLDMAHNFTAVRRR